jgi:hypothetical protein
LDIVHSAARVLELRHRYGYDIKTLEQPVITESGKVHPLGVYTLIPATVPITAKQADARERAAKVQARTKVSGRERAQAQSNGAAFTLASAKG